MLFMGKNMKLRLPQPIFWQEKSQRRDMAQPVPKRERSMQYIPSGFGKLLILAFIFYLNFLSRIIVSPLLPEIKEDLAIGAAQASGMFMFLSIGYFTALLGSGFISSMIGHKKSILLSVCCASLCLVIISLSSKLYVLYAGFLALGLATGIYLPSGIATIASLFDQRFWGRAFSVHELAPNLAFITAPVIASFFLGRSTWHYLMAILAAVSLLTGIIFLRINAGNFPGTAPNLASCSLYLKKKEFWLMTILFGLGITSTLGVYNMLPLFLVSVHSMSNADANLLVSLSRVATLFTAIAGGVLSDRYGPRNVMGWMLLFTGAVTVVLGLTHGIMLHISVFLQPLLAVCFFPAAFAAISELSGPEDRNLLISMVVPFAFLGGGGIMPLIIGIFADHGLFSEGFMLTGLFLASGFLLSRFMPISQNRE